MLTMQDFQPETPATIDLVRHLAELESPSDDKAAVDRLGAFVAQELAALHATITVEERAETGNHVVAHWPGAQPALAAPIVVLCHMDTVWSVGTLARRPVREDQGRLYGPGVFDMKSGIAMLLTALKVLAARGQWPRHPITAIFTADEETGSHFSRELIESHAKGAALALVLEPALPSGALKTARKGTGLIEIVAHGRAAHAGADHAKGRNAIEELAYHIIAAQRLTDYAAGTTVNIGTISGGTRTNVVPAEARAVADVRVASSDEVERLERWTKSLHPVLPGASVSARLTLNRPPMVRDARMTATFSCARSIAHRLGLDLAEASTGGGSDGNFVAALAVPVLDGLGAIGDGGHAENEHILIDSLTDRTALLAALLTEWP
ncbi:MAG TPA: M20 family metallopeptidase [Anaerolineae bacterium]